MAFLPCLNPNCRSKGKSHPNCKCYDDLSGDEIADLGRQGYELPGSTLGLHLKGVRGGNAQTARKRGRQVMYMAEGGEVHYCSLHMPHKPGCEYFKEGGEVSITPQNRMADPSTTLGHAAVSHGLLGLVKDVGRARLSNSEKHAAFIEQTRAQENELGNHLAARNHEGAAAEMHGNPIVGSASKNNLKHVMEQLGPSMMLNEANPEALKSSADYLNSAISGHDVLKSESKKIFGKRKSADEIKPDKNERESLKSHLTMFQEDPAQMFQVAGNLGHYMPEHATAIGAAAATAAKYLGSLKPQQPQAGPMDDPVPPDKSEMAAYNRQVDIAQKPHLLFQHVSDGTLLPQDVLTVQTIFPALYKSMIDKANDSLIEAKTKGVQIPYKQRQAMSLLIGQPLDATMTPDSMQAIIASAGLQQAANQIQKAKEQNGTSAVQMNAIEKTDKLYETPLEARQINKNRS